MAIYDYKKTLSKGTEYSLFNQTPIENGKIRLTTDTKRLFFDIDDERFELTDFIFNYNEEEILALENPIEKFYLAKDTYKLFRYVNSNWITISNDVSHASTADNAGYAERAKKDENNNIIKDTYATKASPTLTGIPKTPTPSGSSLEQIANVGYINTYVADAMSSLTGGLIVIVNSYDDLPNPGESGKIYLVPAYESQQDNEFDEYIWNRLGRKYEKIGSTEINLDGYFNTISVTGNGNAITNINVDSANTSKLNIQKDSTFLTQHPTINRTTSEWDDEPVAGSYFDTVDSLVMDQNGHITGYNTKRVKMPEGTDHAATADFATNAGDADRATNASTAEYAVNAGNATISEIANQSSYSTNAGTADFAINADSSHDAYHAENADVAGEAALAQNAAYDESGYSIRNYITSVGFNENKEMIQVDGYNQSKFDPITIPYAEEAHVAYGVSWNNVSNKPTNIAHATNSDSATYAETVGTIDWSNISNKPTSIQYAEKAGEIAWAGVSNRPTGLSQFENDAHYVSSTEGIDHANYAIHDRLMQVIDDTYIGNIGIDGNELLISKGNGTDEYRFTIPYAYKSEEAISANFATNSHISEYAENSGTALISNTSEFANNSSYSDISGMATNAETANYSINADSAIYATIAETANNVVWDNVGNKPTSIDHADAADHATAAENDGDGNSIKSYVNNIESTTDEDGILITKGDGTITQLNIVNTSSATYARTAGTANSIPWSNISNKPTSIAHADNADNATYATSAGSANSVAWGNVTSKPTTFSPSSHNHSTSEITNFSSSVKKVKVNNAGTANYATSAGDGIKSSSVKWEGTNMIVSNILTNNSTKSVTIPSFASESSVSSGLVSNPGTNNNSSYILTGNNTWKNLNNTTVGVANKALQVNNVSMKILSGAITLGHNAGSTALDLHSFFGETPIGQAIILLFVPTMSESFFSAQIQYVCHYANEYWVRRSFLTSDRISGVAIVSSGNAGNIYISNTSGSSQTIAYKVIMTK